jgi:circadian clock protein KaiB
VLQPPPLTDYDLYLFISGNHSRSIAARENIQRICQQHLAGRYTLTVIDAREHPEKAIEEEILGLPCLIKKRPGLVCRLVGDLSNTERVLAALSLNSTEFIVAAS